VVDEAEPALGDAPEAAERFGGQAWEDLEEHVVGESLGRRLTGGRGAISAETQIAGEVRQSVAQTGR
jgi:hypothetical protein